MEQPSHNPIRKNQDLIESLNNVYKTVSHFSQTLEDLRNQIDRIEAENREKISQIGKLIIQQQNNQTTRNRETNALLIQVDDNSTEMLYIKTQMEVLKDTTRGVKDRMKKLENNVIDVQSNIIQSGNATESDALKGIKSKYPVSVLAKPKPKRRFSKSRHQLSEENSFTPIAETDDITNDFFMEDVHEDVSKKIIRPRKRFNSLKIIKNGKIEKAPITCAFVPISNINNQNSTPSTSEVKSKNILFSKTKA